MIRKNKESGKSNYEFMLDSTITEFLEIAMGEFEDCRMFVEILIDSLVFFAVQLYTLESLGLAFVVVKEACQNIGMFRTHGCLLEFGMNCYQQE